MPICTYLSAGELDLAIENKAVAEALADLRKSDPDGGWVCRERSYRVRRGLFRRPEERKSYSVYKRITGGEYQIINFYRDGTDWSINTSVPAELAVAFMYGACK